MWRRPHHRGSDPVTIGCRCDALLWQGLPSWVLTSVGARPCSTSGRPPEAAARRGCTARTTGRSVRDADRPEVRVAVGRRRGGEVRLPSTRRASRRSLGLQRDVGDVLAPRTTSACWSSLGLRVQVAGASRLVDQGVELALLLSRSSNRWVRVRSRLSNSGGGDRDRGRPVGAPTASTPRRCP